MYSNRYDINELAGSFGDIGTLIPFVVGYVVILHMNPVGVLLAFGLSKIVSGLYYRTPIPIQPMKALGGFAIGHPNVVDRRIVWASGLIIGITWFTLGASRAVEILSKLAAKPVVRGIMLGLGLTFAAMGLSRMSTDIPLAILGVGIALLLFGTRFPAMFAILLLGIAAAIIKNPQLPEMLSKGLAFKLPTVSVGFLSWTALSKGFFLLVLAQLPLTLGNAIIAITHENNQLFPDRPVTERKISISTGIMNIIAPFMGGVPMCHGAGGMAGHVRFGARTGGSIVIIGSLVVLLGLFGGASTLLLLKAFPSAIIGIILFFAGIELSITARDIGSEKKDFYLMILVAAIAMWNMGVAYIAGVILNEFIRRGWVKI
ncbi:MAG: putative sulfate/molybdate transporter [bacterium]